MSRVRDTESRLTPTAHGPVSVASVTSVVNIFTEQRHSPSAMYLRRREGVGLRRGNIPLPYDGVYCGGPNPPLSYWSRHRIWRPTTSRRTTPARYLETQR